jgi:succinyl-diaminopimelate desuccinylase
MLNEIVDLTAELIRFRTTHDRPGEIDRCAAFIADWIEGIGLKIERLSQNGVPSVLVTPRTGKAPLLLMSHIDVVAAPEALFAPQIRDGRLYGRGSIDDKYAAALSMVMIRQAFGCLKEKGFGQSDLSFGILITGDEEIGGRNGADYALGKVSGRFCIALDGGSLDEIVVKEKGVLRLGLTCRGRSAHGARPWLGENAIEKLMDAYRRIRDDFNATGPDHWHRTINFSRVHAGDSPNQVPDRAEAILDIRFTESDDIDTLIERWRQDIDGEIAVFGRGGVFDAGTSPDLDRLCQAAPTAVLTREHGASDARYLAAHGWSGVVWGADGEMSQHGENEHLVIASLGELYHRLERFLLPSIGTP